MAMDKPGWALAVAIGYDATQRLTDILTLRWDGEGFTFPRARPTRPSGTL